MEELPLRRGGIASSILQQPPPSYYSTPFLPNSHTNTDTPPSTAVHNTFDGTGGCPPSVFVSSARNITRSTCWFFPITVSFYWQRTQKRESVQCENRSNCYVSWWLQRDNQIKTSSCATPDWFLGLRHLCLSTRIGKPRLGKRILNVTCPNTSSRNYCR